MPFISRHSLELLQDEPILLSKCLEDKISALEHEKEITAQLTRFAKISDNRIYNLQQEIEDLQTKYQTLLLEIGLHYNIEVTEVEEKVIPEKVIPAHIEIKKVK